METNTIAYTRVSTTDQAENGFSLQMQHDRINAYCSFNNLPTPEIFSDTGNTGRNQKRPALQQILELIDTNQIQHLIVYSLSRLGRNTMQTLQLLEILRKKNITLHSLTEKLDTSTAMGKFFITTIAAIHTLESDVNSERISAVLQNKKSKGEVYCKRITGFKNNEGKLTPIPEELKKVKYILEISESKSPYHTAKILNQQKISTTHGNNFTPAAIKKIIKNKEVYQQHLN